MPGDVIPEVGGWKALLVSRMACRACSFSAERCSLPGCSRSVLRPDRLRYAPNRSFGARVDHPLGGMSLEEAKRPSALENTISTRRFC